MSRVTYLDYYQREEISPIAETTRGKRKLFLLRGYTPLSPASSWDEELSLARTPDRSHWVLWRPALTELEIPRHAIALMPNRGERPRQAAITLVREVWKTEKATTDLSPLSEILRTGLLRPFEIERLNDEVWPEEADDTTLFVRPNDDPPGWEIVGRKSRRLKGRATYGIEMHGPHADFARSLFDPLRTPCDPCHGSGIFRLPPDEPAPCPLCQGRGGRWTAPETELVAARRAFARIYPEAVDPDPQTITSVEVC